MKRRSRKKTQETARSSVMRRMKRHRAARAQKRLIRRGASDYPDMEAALRGAQSRHDATHAIRGRNVTIFSPTSRGYLKRVGFQEKGFYHWPEKGDLVGDLPSNAEMIHQLIDTGWDPEAAPMQAPMRRAAETHTETPIDEDVNQIVEAYRRGGEREAQGVFAHIVRQKQLTHAEVIVLREKAHEALVKAGLKKPMRRPGAREATSRNTVPVETARAVGNRLGVDWKKISLKEFHYGLEEEYREHFGPRDPRDTIMFADLDRAGKIALDHLKEHPDYYKRLRSIGLEAGEAAIPIRNREQFPEILSISTRVDGVNYSIKVPDKKSRNGYDIVDVLVHDNGATTTRSANRSRTTSYHAIQIVKRYAEAERGRIGSEARENPLAFELQGSGLPAMEDATTKFRVGQKVMFGRAHGEQTLGEIVRVNPRTITIRQLEGRGTFRNYRVGTIWRVHPKFVHPAEAGASPTKQERRDLPARRHRIRRAPARTRSQDEIMVDIARTYSGLDPVELTMDGELPGWQVRQRERALNAHLGDLFDELGEYITEDEAYDYIQERRARRKKERASLKREGHVEVGQKYFLSSFHDEDGAWVKVLRFDEEELAQVEVLEPIGREVDNTFYRPGSIHTVNVSNLYATREDVSERRRVHPEGRERRDNPVDVADALPWVKVSRDPERYQAAMKEARALGPIDNAQKVYELVGPALLKEDQETFIVILLDVRQQCRGVAEVHRGGRSRVAVSVVDVMRVVVASGAEGFVVVHNHPTTNATPSDADKDLTKSIERAAKMFDGDLTFIDHVICGDREFYSFADKKLHRLKTSKADKRRERKVRKALAPLDAAHSVPR